MKMVQHHTIQYEDKKDLDLRFNNESITDIFKCIHYTILVPY